jgi:hypothetical protein
MSLAAVARTGSFDVIAPIGAGGRTRSERRSEPCARCVSTVRQVRATGRASWDRDAPAGR